MEDQDKILLSADALLAMVVAEMEVREIEALSAPDQADENDLLSERFHREMGILKNEAIRKKRMARFQATVKRAFLVIAVATTVFSFAMLPVHAVREAVISTVLEWHDQFLTVFLSAEDSVSSGEAPSLQNISLAYIPAGFSVASESRAQESFYAYYESPDGNWFTLSAYLVTAQQAYALDNEGVQYRFLQFDGKDALWASFSEGIHVILWQDGAVSFALQGSLDLAELIHIAESIGVQTDG